MVIKESWFQEGNMDEVKKSLQDLDPRIRAAVEKTESCLDWSKYYLPRIIYAVNYN